MCWHLHSQSSIMISKNFKTIIGLLCYLWSWWWFRVTWQTNMCPIIEPQVSNDCIDPDPLGSYTRPGVGSGCHFWLFVYRSQRRRIQTMLPSPSTLTFAWFSVPIESLLKPFVFSRSSLGSQTLFFGLLLLYSLFLGFFPSFAFLPVSLMGSFEERSWSNPN